MAEFLGSADNLSTNLAIYQKKAKSLDDNVKWFFWRGGGSHFFDEVTPILFCSVVSLKNEALH